MNNELIERIDAVLESWQGVTVLPDDIYVLQDCKAALTQQQEAEPVFENLMVGNATTLNDDDYPGLGEWWIQLRIGPTHDEVLARVYGNSVSEVRERADAICNALHPPKPAAQPQVPDGDEIYRRFCAWCDKNKALDLDPRLHKHSGNSVSNGAYIGDIATRVVFSAFRDGLLSAAKEEGK